MTAEILATGDQQPAIHRSPLPGWQNLMVIAITLVYLICELAFNSRLLDIVGGIASSEQVHNMERYGRSLTSIAAALLVLQFMLAGLARLRRRSVPLRPARAISAVLLVCGITAGLTWYGVERFIEHQVTRSDGQFRQTALLAQLYQHALINGNQVLEGITPDDDGRQTRTWNSPSGKAFLAMLPVLLSSVNSYHQLLTSGAQQNLRDSLLAQEGGVRGYYRAWITARQRIYQQYRDYLNDNVDLSATISREQDRAWARYERSLRRNRLSPWNVPRRYHNRVRAQVRQQGVPVTNSWSPSDRQGFNAAVEKTVWQRFKAQRTVEYQGLTINKGLDWKTFYALPVVQKSLREGLRLPASVTLLPEYPLDDKLKSFVLAVQTPHLDYLVSQQLPRLRAAAESYGPGGSNQSRGEDAARAILVPPIALFFSLCGAMTHLAKLMYLLLVQISPALVSRWPNRATRLLNHHPLLVPLVIIAALLCCFRISNNAITASPMYRDFRAVLRDAPVSITGEPLPLSGGTLLGIVHTVSIGQSLSYPLNEGLRTRLLGGFEFGYSEEKTGKKGVAEQ